MSLKMRKDGILYRSKLKYPLEKKKVSEESENNTIDTHYEKSQFEILFISIT